MTDSVIVLKFGGSVLHGPDALPAIVTEIRRFGDAGLQVVAVVSAMAGRTDALLAECRAAGALSPFAMAARVALGELESAALLGRALRPPAGDATWKDAAVLAPAALSLRAIGPPLDADPVEVAIGCLRAALQQHRVVVVPGFVATDGQGRTVLLGRGGSDLTALFLAQQLGARCRLVKDAGGLFDRAPAQPGALPVPRATWAELLATDGRVVQRKAVAFAQAHRVTFELAALGGLSATIVGDQQCDAECG